MPTRSPRRSGRSAIADPADLAGTLAPLARLALAYAPAGAREDWLTLLALDARLAGVVRSAREPMLAQLKLAWWRDRLGADPAAWPKGEPLLERLADWPDPAGLVALVDGWEALLADPPLDAEAVKAFAEGRGGAMAVLARRLGLIEAVAANAGREWALAELALAVELPPDVSSGPPSARLPRRLRPLAVLRGVTHRALARGGAEAIYRPGTWLVAVRIGLIGR